MSYYQHELTRYQNDMSKWKSKPSVVRLHELIKWDYIHHGYFELSGGKKSEIYFNIKSMLTNRIHCNKLKDVMDEYLFELEKDWGKNPIKLDFKTIAGLELGGALLVASLKTMKHKCFIRKTERKHGLTNMIIDNPVNPILLVDDVLTSGNTVRSSIEICENNGFNVSGVLCVINRSNKCKIVNGLMSEGYPIFSLFDESDFKFNNKII